MTQKLYEMEEVGIHDFDIFVETLISNEVNVSVNQLICKTDIFSFQIHQPASAEQSKERNCFVENKRLFVFKALSSMPF